MSVRSSICRATLKVKTRDDLSDFICLLNRAEHSLAELDKRRSFQLVDDILVHSDKSSSFPTAYARIYEKLI